jgi:ribosomal protein S18 acetylase RimI-like enzyme
VSEIVVRKAEPGDLARVGELAGQLVRMHHAADPARFFLPERVEEGYVRWFSREIRRGEAVVLVAEVDGAIAGYAYGAIEDRDWAMLLDRHGALHDVFVDAKVRRGGVGRALVRAMVAALEALGAPIVVLSTMVANENAQRVFRACGFRSTMLEMTCDTPLAPK